MEHLTFDYPAQRAVTTRAHVGVVGSGDLEVLLSPAADSGTNSGTNAAAMTAHVVVRTSVDGYGHIWKSVLDRFFTRYDGAAQIEINDFGATPGVVALRLAEAVEAAEQGDDA
ncbi:malonate decarboxylase subunit delta [bacterium M00.F.Ca.ET.228.01.1.1]|uniref:Malonate decarboxylase acyl carrier protein n=1 Tax=Burkholderia sp. (strain CCGE1003) TaxID=640512 RepID=E1TG27_BURSG|nr:malonate decarboxylase subunit delta [Paraburkholderia phenoliruptrix]TGP40745.1 malonate decarboxylase subunit delta [bacterium M00.F.Ca.ET.228.01.1.1]TGR96996.1 malonate decarboxylase subunit delta [bacterium M00.F.Ca.ET.191.01.1.1]TGT98306.1 malonate decarboxylase subunit delta [bacterium M00.F.Ca.ET.155.01.1.1]MBW0448248.1 malonate decarboxylase subunit delta [Paraburkholderia phenoliruptrix]MBW9100355.1 malonate decarboxylase subunit delta [Paraburkholderia phenoliruptrix]